MADGISIVIPARNEAETVGRVVAAVAGRRSVNEVIVVDNASWDGTAEAAAEAGATVIEEAEPGLGRALKTGFAAAKGDWVMKIDADLETFDSGLVETLTEAREPGVGMIKGNWQDPTDDLPMTRLLIRPAIKLIYPELAHVRAPNSGIYLFDRDLIDLPKLADTNAADIDVMLRVHTAGYAIAEVEIGEIKHDPRNKQHYNAMAENILNLFLKHHAQQLEG
ncbi:glycosyltransferase [Roseovarius indicus]|jgi:glycosyltransferase involved in cell wall biosynthesis|uniref:Glucosyl-3-phosphoglycerate synthase n=1 Tax=Roseovarius indicus TaxID=540747 RepID=A0A5P3A861_9RHOB|nr:glycosyltransferase [Roseovarius indicus]QEW24893.1 Glucosyl-3-phosphoglycerate synthase [Roseovarius indicus]SFE49267.1 Glycosyltransferase involved in cell wall bisynthesis [Roseovarius indicus]